MRIKIGKVEADIPVLLALFGLLVVDNLYANHCKKKTVNRLIKQCGKLDKMALNQKKEGLHSLFFFRTYYTSFYEGGDMNVIKSNIIRFR